MNASKNRRIKCGTSNITRYGPIRNHTVPFEIHVSQNTENSNINRKKIAKDNQGAMGLQHRSEMFNINICYLKNLTSQLIFCFPFLKKPLSNKNVDIINT